MHLGHQVLANVQVGKCIVIGQGFQIHYLLQSIADTKLDGRRTLKERSEENKEVLQI